MYTKIPDLAYEIHEDCINLEQDGGCGEVDRVTLHSIHVRLLASSMGLLQGDADAWRRVETLERRMLVLLDRIDRLDDMVSAAWAKGHEDLEVESTFSYATWELASEFCADFAKGATDCAGEAEGALAKPEATLSVPAGSPSQQRGLPLETQE